MCQMAGRRVTKISPLPLDQLSRQYHRLNAPSSKARDNVPVALAGTTNNFCSVFECQFLCILVMCGYCFEVNVFVSVCCVNEGVKVVSSGIFMDLTVTHPQIDFVL